MFDGVKQSKLTKPEKARFALVYMIAQDKSGLDVDNDSFLRIPYTYYNNKEDDSLYAKCMNYMGKCYQINFQLWFTVIDKLSYHSDNEAD